MIAVCCGGKYHLPDPVFEGRFLQHFKRGLLRIQFQFPANDPEHGVNAAQSFKRIQPETGRLVF